MEQEQKKQVILALGQSDKPPIPRRFHPDSKIAPPLSLVEEIHAEAVGIAAYSHDPYHLREQKPIPNVIFMGDNPNGYEEAEEMEKFATEKYSYLRGKTKVINGTSDTATQAELLKEALKEYGEVEVSIVTTLDHDRRAIRNLKANGINIVDEYSAHELYVKDRFISKRMREKRKVNVQKAWINVPMYLSMVRENFANIEGLVDKKGKVPQWFARTFRIRK